jgi:hypothetical protein
MGGFDGYKEPLQIIRDYGLMLDLRKPILVTSKMTMSNVADGYNQLFTVFIDYYISYFGMLSFENRELLAGWLNHHFVTKAARKGGYDRILQHHYGFNL